MPLPELLAGAEIHAKLDFGIGDIKSSFDDALDRRAALDAIAAYDIEYQDRWTAEGTTDGSGNLTLKPASWQAPQGYRVNFHRITIDYAGANANAPVNAANIRIYLDQSAQAGGNLATLGNAIPAVFEWSNQRVAVHLRSEQKLCIVITASAANKAHTVTADITVTKEML